MSYKGNGKILLWNSEKMSAIYYPVNQERDKYICVFSKIKRIGIFSRVNEGEWI